MHRERRAGARGGREEEAKAKALEHRREDEEAGIVRVDSDDEDFGTLVTVQEEAVEPVDGDGEEGWV